MRSLLSIVEKRTVVRARDLYRSGIHPEALSRALQRGLKVPQLPSKAPFSKRFEEAVGQACESASVRQVARQFGLPASTVRAIDLRYLKRWSARARKDGLEQMGVDEIYFGKQMKFITVVSNLETGEALWFTQQGRAIS
jgi:hypothetical protein